MILLSYSANFFIYCAMSAQFRATLFEAFSRRRESSFTTATEPLSGRFGGRRSTAANAMTPAAGSAAKPISLTLMSNVNEDSATGTRPEHWKTGKLYPDWDYSFPCTRNLETAAVRKTSPRLKRPEHK